MKIKIHDPIILDNITIREGDTLLCIKNFPEDAMYHTKGQKYKVKNTYINVIIMNDNFNHYTEYMHNIDLPANRRVLEYFTSIREMRKQKINKINDCNLQK